MPIVFILAIGALIAIRSIPITPGSQDPDAVRTIYSLGVVAAVVFVLPCWSMFALLRRWRHRMLAFVVLTIAGVAVCESMELDGISGSWQPIVRLRKPRVARATISSPNQPRNKVDLSTPGIHDFPQFLGSKRHPAVDNVRLNPDWRAHPPRLLWKRAIGAGWSSFAIVGDYAVTQEQVGDYEEIACYHVLSGTPQWRYAYPAAFVADALHLTIAGQGPRATPTISGGRVYSVGATGVVNCLDGSTGSLIWSRNMREDANATIPEAGYACSPLVLDDLVIVVPGGLPDWLLIAYDKSSGRLVWHGGPGDGGYCSPAIAELAGVPQVVVMAFHGIVAVDPSNGRTLYQRPWGVGSNNIAQPIPVGSNGLFVSSGHGYGCQLFEVYLSRHHHLQLLPAWEQNRNMRFKFSNGVVTGHYVYGFDDGVLACLDLVNGTRCWRGGRYGHGQLILVDDLLLVLGEWGELYLVRAAPDRHQQLGMIQALDGKTWSSPALSGGRLLVRNGQEAACFELSLADERSSDAIANP